MFAGAVIADDSATTSPAAARSKPRSSMRNAGIQNPTPATIDSLEYWMTPSSHHARVRHTHPVAARLLSPWSRGGPSSPSSQNPAATTSPSIDESAMIHCQPSGPTRIGPSRFTTMFEEKPPATKSPIAVARFASEKCRVMSSIPG